MYFILCELFRLHKYDPKHHLFFNIDLPVVKIRSNRQIVFIFKNVFKLYVVTVRTCIRKDGSLHAVHVLGSVIIEEQFVQKHSNNLFNHRMRMFFPALN